MISDLRKIFHFISDKELKRLYLLSFLLFVSVVIEVASLGLLFPTIELVLNSGNVSNNFIFSILKISANFKNFKNIGFF